MKHEKTNGHSFAPSRSDPRLVLSRVIFYLRKAAAAKRKWERCGENSWARAGGRT